MPRIIQIRHVPDDVHRKLKVRAALAGMSLSEYLLSEVRRALERPTRAEILERLARRRPVRLRDDPVGAVREERDRR
jgi:plasmid stability protein